MNLGERRELVFTNLVNGIRVADVMTALQLSEKEVLADFAFVAGKIRSYRFERSMRAIPADTVELARANRVELLFTVSRLNLGKDPLYSRIVSLPLTVDNGGKMSDAELAIMAMRARAASR